MLAPEQIEAFSRLPVLLKHCQDPWWIIGGAGLLLHGVPVQLKDVDVLLSERDAVALQQRLNLPNVADRCSDRFRSKIFLKLEAPIPLEFMGDFSVATKEGWHILVPRTRQRFCAGHFELWVPDLTEMISILEMFGRNKDTKKRALALNHLMASTQ
ncbi:hypothetical protein PUV47_01035 [Pseudovibrio exalbescens]|uniref:hypothetical protein n=1 Tax=Pseudovibrio exalbescens TaxID=197461 RepID=UPI0023666BC8|nr:hypothetical protein [Pseudovibrio exalbescens]MDD7908489.1 hypothetical protein [Pseudovibrio exalbescens]